MDISIQLMEEISIIFFWVGSSGLLDRFVSNPIIKQSKIYVYIMLVLIAIYLKL